MATVGTLDVLKVPDSEARVKYRGTFDTSRPAERRG
jgi:hypothetical protein